MKKDHQRGRKTSHAILKTKDLGRRLSEDKNCTSTHEKIKVDCYRMSKCQRVKEFVSSQVTTPWREG